MFPTFWSPPAVSLCAPLIEMSLQSKRRRLLMSHSPMMVMVFFSGHNWKGASTSTFEWEAFEYHWYMKYCLVADVFYFLCWWTVSIVIHTTTVPLWFKWLIWLEKPFDEEPNQLLGRCPIRICTGCFIITISSEDQRLEIKSRACTVIGDSWFALSLQGLKWYSPYI